MREDRSGFGTERSVRVALKRGFFSQQGLEAQPVVIRGSDKAIQALVGGSVNVTVSAPHGPTIAANCGLDTVIVVGNSQRSAHWILGRKNYKTFEDLCGATIVPGATLIKNAEIPLRVTREENLVAEWELVLLAQGLSPSVGRSAEGFVLRVPAEEVDKARAALSAYESDNQAKLQEGDQPAGSASLLAGIVVAGMLLVFFSVTLLTPAVPWFEQGSADANRIVRGEIWRTVTALTLHADLVHAATNAIAAALFIGALSGILGAGVGSVLVLLAGAGGNLVNALLHGFSHIAVGASTSVFGAVGMLGGLGMIRRRRRAARARGAWLPIAAALALLGMLGTGGQRVDIWADLFGLVFGGVLGILIALLAPRPRGASVQWACGSAALIVLIYCWIIALL